MALGTGLLLASVGQQLFSSIRGRNKERDQRRQRRRFFDRELKPLLDETTQDVDVDFNAIRDAEMRMPTLNFQEGFRSLTRTRDATQAQSGFGKSGFIERDFTDSSNMLGEQFKSQEFNINRGVMDLQSQLENIVAENKIRAKELEYQYKYG